MNFSEQLEKIFVTEEEIPAEYKLSSEINQKTFLLKGEMVQWDRRKDSAEETLSVVDALRSFSIRSLVATKINDSNKHLLNEIISGEDSNFLSTKFIF